MHYRALPSATLSQLEPYELDVDDGHCVVRVWLPKVAAKGEEVLSREKDTVRKVFETNFEI